MKKVLVILFGFIVYQNLYARDDTFLHKNIEFYENKTLVIKDEQIINDDILAKYSIFDSGFIENYNGINALYLRAYKIKSKEQEEQKYNLQKVIPSYIKKYYTKNIESLTLFEPLNQSCIYPKIEGILYIAKPPYNPHYLDFLSQADYSVIFHSTYDPLYKNSDGENGFLTIYLKSDGLVHPSDYPKIEALFANMGQNLHIQLKEKSSLIVPINLQLKIMANIELAREDITIYKIANIQISPNKDKILNDLAITCANTALQYRGDYCNIFKNK